MNWDYVYAGSIIAAGILFAALALLNAFKPKD
jgi:hypothetical protein